jgi:hypothetical protein
LPQPRTPRGMRLATHGHNEVAISQEGNEPQISRRLKINRDGAPNLLIQKHCIKYLFKQDEL